MRRTSVSAALVLVAVVLAIQLVPYGRSSWLVQRDVDEGRRTLNFSEWDRAQREAHESASTVRKREMPPWFYELRARGARLTTAERSALAAGLAATVGRDRERKRE